MRAERVNADLPNTADLDGIEPPTQITCALPCPSSWKRPSRSRAWRYVIPGLLFSLVAGTGESAAQTAAPPVALPSAGALDNPALLPDLSRVLPPATDAKGATASLQILVLLTVLTFVPAILIMMTSFPRVVVVLGLLRQAIGVPQLPPAQVLVALALFMTFIIMAPVWQRVYTEAVTPYLENRISQRAAFDVAGGHVRRFMYRQIEQSDNLEDVYLFLEYAQNREIPAGEAIDVDGVPLTVMVPAFMLSELKTAFVIGFRIYLPFLVIDMVIAAILLSMGMMMLPPVLISLPFKLLLFVLADGWRLIAETLLYSFV